MAIDPAEFWGENYYGHPPLIEEMVSLAEETLLVKLPATYVNLLRIQNGGYTQGFGFPMQVQTRWAEDHIPLDELFGIVVDGSIVTAQNILDSHYLSEEWGLPPRQVLLNGDGHWWITLDYRKDNEPTVAWIDTEGQEEFTVAATFDEFVAALKPSETFSFD